MGDVFLKVQGDGVFKNCSLENIHHSWGGSGQSCYVNTPFRAMEFNKRLFQQCDKNGDGKICAEELVNVFNNLGHSFSVEEAQDMIKNVGNNDDVITFDEFFEISEDWETSFNIFDTDGNGQISAAELRQKLTDFGLFATDLQVYPLFMTFLFYSEHRIFI